MMEALCPILLIQRMKNHGSLIRRSDIRLIQQLINRVPKLRFVVSIMVPPPIRKGDLPPFRLLSQIGNGREDLEHMLTEMIKAASTSESSYAARSVSDRLRKRKRPDAIDHRGVGPQLTITLISMANTTSANAPAHVGVDRNLRRNRSIKPLKLSLTNRDSLQMMEFPLTLTQPLSRKERGSKRLLSAQHRLPH